MNALLPYEEQLSSQFGELELALPDENLAWADLKRRLDEDDDDRLIPVWLRGCLPAGLLIIALLGAGWWLVRPEKWFDKTGTGEKVIEKSGDTSTENPGSRISFHDSAGIIDHKPMDSIPSKANRDSVSVFDPGIPVETKKTKPVIGKPANPALNKGNKPNPIKPGIVKTVPVTDTSGQLQNKDEQPTHDLITKTPPASQPGRDTVTVPPPVNRDNSRPADSVKKNISVTSDSLNKRDSSGKANVSKKDKTPPPVFFSAGIALQQQLPINGQKWTPYNSVGRKGTLADYIPSVYARVEKKQKWFMQGEFKYGAPQYNRPLVYYKRVDTTVVAQKYSTTSQQLEKTYYHHLGLSFNYYVLPGWSVGTGIGWNKFYRAVSTQDVVEHTITTGQDTLLASGNIIRNSNPDSNFVNSWYQAMFETQYKWKRFSIGARYSVGLQPFIRFKLPGGTHQEEKSSSFLLFLRYELWKSKEK
jgi:hypothetical protein